MIAEKKGQASWGGTFVLATLVIFLVGSTGCINMITKSADSGTVVAPAVTPSVAEPPKAQTTVPRAPSSNIRQPVPQVTPLRSNVVTEVAPFTTTDPYPIIHGVQINSTPRYAFIYRQPEFTKTYSLKGNAVGLLVNVVQGPLYIRYTITPKNDCLKSPDSCRGSMQKSVNRPYMTITVRDNETREIVAEDGYAREYSSNTGKYSFSSSSSDEESDQRVTTDNSDSGTYVEDPGPRYIAIYKEGRFHITIEGNYLDTAVSVITGASPDLLTAQEKSTSGVSVPSSDTWN